MGSGSRWGGRRQFSQGGPPCRGVGFWAGWSWENLGPRDNLGPDRPPLAQFLRCFAGLGPGAIQFAQPKNLAGCGPRLSLVSGYSPTERSFELSGSAMQSRVFLNCSLPLSQQRMPVNTGRIPTMKLHKCSSPTCSTSISQNERHPPGTSNH